MSDSIEDVLEQLKYTASTLKRLRLEAEVSVQQDYCALNPDDALALTALKDTIRELEAVKSPQTAPPGR